MIYHCCNESRKNAVRNHPTLNGIDFLEVTDAAQTTLELHFLKPLAPGSLHKRNVFIEGGDRINSIQVTDAVTGAQQSPVADDRILTVKVAAPGDFSDYTLRLALDERQPTPPPGFDTVLSTVVFSFKVACPTEFDCQPSCDCPPETSTAPPDINYLAKDYATFRRLMLDRISFLLPNWKERNPADLGIVLVEMLAYTADYLSYRQDAVATEAYLGTARKRSSIRRHARLVDYRMHDGCNARTWLQIQVGEGANGTKLERGSGNSTTKVLTKVEGLPPIFNANSEAHKKALAARPKVFQLMHDIELYEPLNRMSFYTWGDTSCCLPKGATQATLRGYFPQLKKGSVLILVENRAPDTGEPQDANPAKRHAVRLVEDVVCTYDALYDAAGKPIENPLSSPPGSPPSSPPDSPPSSPPEGPSYLQVTEIYWHSSDALPFSLCISTENFQDVSVALGNIVLVDHGMSVEDTGEFRSLSPNTVQARNMAYVEPDESCSCQEVPPVKAVPLRYRPMLGGAPLTVSDLTNFNEDHTPKPVSATALMRQSVGNALPAVTLLENGGSSQKWVTQRDLLGSGSNKREFVVETEADGSSFLRFGDNKLGAQPNAGTDFLASYRIGNGSQGNIGAGALAHIIPSVATSMEVISVGNPLPAQGGTEPESMEAVRQFAPQAFRTQERAVTSADYEEFAKKSHPEVQKTAVTLRWTGSWRTVFLTADRMGGQEVNAEFEKDLRLRLERYRMAGFDLEVDSPLFVPLDIELQVCVHPDFFASDVKKALLNAFSKRAMPDGSLGVFHPDNFSFGQPVYLSRLYAAAQAVEGVISVQISRFERQGTPDAKPIEEGMLLMGRREIARCDNDRNFPDRGVFNLNMKGGK